MTNEDIVAAKKELATKIDGIVSTVPSGPEQKKQARFPVEWGNKEDSIEVTKSAYILADAAVTRALVEKERTNVAVMDRPSDKLDPGKKYRVLLFNDENNTREYVIEVLMKYIPGMSAEMAKEITARAHNTGMAIVGIWMYELAEGYSDILRSNGLKSDIEAD